MKTPNAQHPITIRRTGARVVIRHDDVVIADTTDALTLQESTYPAVQYVPRKDVDLTLLARTEHSTHCPYKGDAAYFSLPWADDAVWTYESPYPDVAAIQDHLAFYPQHVEVVLEVGGGVSSEVPAP